MSDLSRRKFLNTASAAALVTAIHRPLIWAGPIVNEPHATARILSLRLRTAAPLEKMKAFYSDTLGLAVLEESATELTIGGGATPVTFVKADAAHGAPFYHFAFNIPQNKIREAREWQRERSEILPVFPHLRDDKMPGDIVHFSHWNAHSVFFFDPAENVVEYIARHDLDNDSDGPFTSRDILHASEIAFIVDDVPAVASKLQETFDLAQYRSGSDVFRALGDEHGLVLVFERGRNISMGSETSKLADVFPTYAEIRGPATTHAVAEFDYQIRGSG